MTACNYYSIYLFQNDSGDLRGVAGGDGELGCLCGKAGTSHLCDGSAHSSGCVVNGYGCRLSYFLFTYFVFTYFYLPAGEVRKVFPGGWDDKTMLQKLNQGFIDYRNKNKQ